MNKLLTEIPDLAHFARDRNNLVTTDASRTGHGITQLQKQSDNTIRRKAFAEVIERRREKLSGRRARTNNSSMGTREFSFRFVRLNSMSTH